MEVPSLDDATTVTYANPDGTMTAHLSAGPVRVQQNGQWVPVDPTLVATGGTVAPKAVAGAPSFAGALGAGGGTLASVGVGSNRLAYRWPGALPAPTLSGNTATYPNVVPNGDLVLTATTRGFEVSLLLHKAPAAALNLRLPVSAGGLTLAQAGNGDLNLTDPTGKTVAHAPAPTMCAATNDARSGLPNRCQPVSSTLVAGPAGQELDITPDQSWLTDPATTYPVTLDPATNLSDTLDDYVSSAYASTNYDGSAELHVGSYNGGADKSRTFVQVNDSAIKGQSVTSATLNAYEIWSYSCTDTEMIVEGAYGMGPGRTWNTQPGVDGHRWGDSYFHGGYSGCPSTAGWKAIPITGLVQGWSGNGAASPEALAMLAPNETDDNQWKRFNSGNTTTGPYVSVDYAAPVVVPATPTGLAADDTSTYTPRLSGAVSSPAGGGLNNYFYVSSAGTTSPDVINGALVSAGSGSRAAYTIPTGKLHAGDTYTWHMKSCNASACSPDTASQSFTVDPLLGIGDRPFFHYDIHKLTDRFAVKANIASGNLLAQASDLKVPGLNGDLNVGRTYNSRTLATGRTRLGGYGTGYGWQMNASSDYRVQRQADGAVSVDFPDGFVGQYTLGCGGYCTPAGLDADLTHNSSANTYTLTDHRSQQNAHFDAAGTLIGDTDRNGNTVAYGYSTCNNQPQVATITGTRGDSSGRKVTVNYDAGCNRTGLTQTGSDGTSRSTTIGQDTALDVTSFRDAAGGTYSLGYDTSHNLTSITTPGGHSTAIGYDGMHRVTQLVQDTAGIKATTSYGYVSPTETDVTDPNGHTTKYTIDVYGRVTKTVDALGHTQSAAFNPDNNVSSFAGAAGTTTFGYVNNNESPSSTTGPLGAASSTAYANTSPSTQYLPTSTTNSDGVKNSFSYDGPGNQSATSGGPSTSPDESYVHHNANGTSDFTTEPGNKGKGSSAPANCTRPAADGGGVDNCTHSTYDALGNLVSTVPPDGNSLRAEARTYDGFGRLHTATTGRALTTTYSYDNLDRVTALSYSDPKTPALVYGYGSDGELNTRTDATGTTAYTYDNLHRLTGKTATGGASYQLGYTYDRVGNLDTLTDGRGTTSYTYDRVNLLTRLVEGKTGNSDLFAYNNDNHRTDTWYNASGFTLDAGYHPSIPTGFAGHVHSTLDSANRLTGLKTTRSSADTSRVSDLTYTYKNASGGDTNSRHAVTDNLTAQTTTYGFDSAGRLTSAATSGGGPAYGYCYDPNGNLTVQAASAVTCGSTPANHAYNSANQLTDSTTGYDADGNLTSSPTSTPALDSLVYNGAGQNTAVTPHGAASADNLTYAGPDQGERASADTTSYANGPAGVQSATAPTSTSYYERDPGGTLIAAQTTIGTTTTETYYYFDGIGSVLGMLDPSGKQVATYTYDPYGGHANVGNGEASDSTQANANLWRYASGQADATTGLTKFGVRYYDPSGGRWTQLDPLQHLLDLRQGNRYGYAGSDPINNTDPRGADDVSSSLPQLNGCVTADGNPVVGCVPATGNYTQGECTFEVYLVGLFAAPIRTYGSLVAATGGYVISTALCGSFPKS